MKIRSSQSGRKLRNKVASDSQHEIIYTLDTYLITPSYDSQATVSDCLFDVHNTGSYFIGGYLRVENAGNVSIVSVDPIIATVDEYGTIGSAGSGTAICDNIADLNQMIVDADTLAGVSTGYPVTEADFSAFLLV